HPPPPRPPLFPYTTLFRSLRSTPTAAGRDRGQRRPSGCLPPRREPGVAPFFIARKGSSSMNERDSTRRTFLKQSIAVAGLSLAAPAFLRSAAWAAGSDAPEKTDLRIGFIPLTDCASVVVAATQGFGSKYGLNITPSKEASWAGVRDKLNTGELDA